MDAAAGGQEGAAAADRAAPAPDASPAEDHSIAEGLLVGEARMEVDEGVADRAASVAPESKNEVDEGGAGGAADGECCSAASAAASAEATAGAGGGPGPARDSAPVACEAMMEVDGGEQGRGAGAVGGVEAGDGTGGVVDQGPAAADAGGRGVGEEGLAGRCIGSGPDDPGRTGVLVEEDGSKTGACSVVFEDGRGEDLGADQVRECLGEDGSKTVACSVVFEDGRGEDLGADQVQERLVSGENGAVGCRKRKLDDVLVPSEAEEPASARQKVDGCEEPKRPDAPQRGGSGSDASEAEEPASARQKVDGREEPERPDAPRRGGSGSDASEDVESSSNSSDFAREGEPSEPCPAPAQAVELPPSSGDIPVPEECISHLFSVYNFLRSFGVQLFLSPFGLDDFVAAANCAVQNNLLDAVHVSLLRALRRHLESKSAEGSQLASNCLKNLDWTLLDALTWPNFLLQYLCVMGCIRNLGGRSFARSLLATEYYKLPVAMKLRMLQILCDHLIESEELKTELESREGYNEEMEYGMDSLEAGSRTVSTRALKATAYKRTNDLQDLESAPVIANPEAAVADVSQDGNSDDCRICGMDGTLVCCDGCPWAYHSRCIGQNKASLPQGVWFCPECVVNKLGPTSTRIERGARGAQMFGIDMCGRLFLGTCDYLLVIETSSDAESYARYYNHHDVAKVLQRIALSDAYVDICSQITEYWKDLLGIVQSERSKIGKEVGVSHTPQPSRLSFTFTPTKADGGDSRTVALPQANAQQKFAANQYTLCSAKHLDEQKSMYSLGAANEKNAEVCKQILSAQDSTQNAPLNGAFGPSVVPSVSHQNGSVITGVSNIAQAQSAQSLFRPDLSSASAKAESFCPSYQSKNHHQLFAERPGNMSGVKAAKLSSFKPQAYMNLYYHGNIAASAAANLAVITSDEGKVSASQLIANPRKKIAADNALQLKAFSPAAAQFIWPSTEKKLMEVPRDRCGWCLACRSSAIGNKKACFLNMATANAAKGSARILSAMHVIKNSDSHFPTIAAYLASMEESLRGLLVGSLQDMQQKQRWHKQLQQASNCRTVIPLLLELERNIRGVAFSASWLKPTDDWPVESPGLLTGASRPAPLQKRGAGGRRGRKRLLASESGTATDDDRSWTWWTGGSISKRTLQRGALLCSTTRKAARQGGKRRIAGLSYHEGSNFPRRTRQFTWRECVRLSQTSSQLALQVRYLDAHIRWKEFIPPDQMPSDGKNSDADFRNAVLCDKKMIDNKIRYALKFPNQKHLPVCVTKIILEKEGDHENIKFWFSENHVPLYMLREFEQKVGISSLATPGILDSNCVTNLYPRRVKASTGDIFSYLFHKGDVYPCTSCKKDVVYRDIVKCSSCQGNCHKECTSRSVDNKGGSATSNLICKLCLQKRNLMLTRYNTNTSYIRPQQKSYGQQPVTAPRIVFKVGSSHSMEPALKVEAQPVTKVKAQPIMNVKNQPIENVKAHTIVKIGAQPLAKVEALPIKNLATENITSVQAQSKTKAKKSEKTKKPKKVQAITYFGLVWKRNKNDKDDGSDFRATDVILKSKDGIGSSIRPTCCLCAKTYSPDFLYVRCEKCGNWFHGDALQLDEERIGELVGYRCCRCRRRAIPQCPHSDDYAKPEPEFSEQAVSTSSVSTMLSSQETFALADQDPLLASYGGVEPIGEETVDADLSMNMASFAPGSNQKLSIRRAQTKNPEYFDQAIKNQSPGNGNTNFSHMNGISFLEADNMDSPEQLGWDFSQGTAYAAPPDFTANQQSNDASRGSFVMGEYEPQTYFSFTELLEADDMQLDSAFGMSTSLQNNGTVTGNSVQQRVSFGEMTFMVEDGASNMNFPTNEPTPEKAACHKCKNTQPPPDLKCVVCDLHIHRQCSPWDQGVEPIESSNWSCGGCREWR